ncbi:Os01g0802900 [Oryza sativa Japonica Group]|uniref:Os01g0802900 protein n=1 Tax=Oryza sativa subsp. japonica TaxID=39947 RepID=A0A0P0V9C1_ORYSJ|nr:hypothetical protein EE612_006328 [Oryza sativa]BAS74812.1 Os01g0802900 [Oryza sativa Japonica Group]
MTVKERKIHTATYMYDTSTFRITESDMPPSPPAPPPPSFPTAILLPAARRSVSPAPARRWIWAGWRAVPRRRAREMECEIWEGAGEEEEADLAGKEER